MGIPKFFKWLTRRYPLILQNIKTEEDAPQVGKYVAVHLVDNFYLDLNGIVHNCIHGNDPKRHERISKLNDLEEVWAALMQQIDQLVHTIKPHKVLFLAVDGVAPRAKMNQQRARRFRSAKEAQTLKEQLRAQGKNIPDLFDSNAISPGTPFMMELCDQLHFFVKYKVSTDPLYQKLEQVIVSDGSVPGEGEHKMLDFIRQLRTKPNYDPNTRHCFYGADADLIMLSLLTHEPHFTIIREEHVVKKMKNGGVQRLELSKTANFQIIYVTLLREYMMLEYKPLAQKMKMKFDLERIIDDFIFFCFFIGNDFLPSLSALDIAEGSLDKLIDFYQKCLPTMTNYITQNGTVHWDRAEPFIWLLAEHENEVFKARIDQIEDRRRQPKTISISEDANLLMGESNQRNLVIHNVFKEQIYGKKVAKVQKLVNKKESKKYKRFLIGKLFKEDLKEMTQARRVEFDNTFAKYQLRKSQESSLDPQELFKIIEEADLSDLKPEEIPDDCISDVETLETLQGNGLSSFAQAQIQLESKAEEKNLKFMSDFVKIYAQDSQAAKQFYYKTKVEFDIMTPHGEAKRKKMLKKYLEGTQWVLFYYYKGSQHWRWYYPYHYAPMISDLGQNIVQDFLGCTTISEFEVDYNCPTNSKPYTPFQQLLCIMPLKSFHLLPAEYRNIAENKKEYFPNDFEVDLNGKTLAWEAIVLIPFCDEESFLLEEQKMFEQGFTLNNLDKIRNVCVYELYSYNYNPVQDFKELRPTLKKFTTKVQDLTRVTLINEYENVGSLCFKSQLLPGVKKPLPGYPSFDYLGVQELESHHVIVQKVEFVKQLVKIGQCIEETQPEILEKFIDKLAKSVKKEVYVNFPFQNEAFAMYFEDKFTIYTIFGDTNTNQFTVQKSAQFRNDEEWNQFVSSNLVDLMDYGVFCPRSKVNVIVTCNRVKGIEQDRQTSQFYKIYQEKPDVIPLSLLMKRRDQGHPMSVVDIRVGHLSCQEIKKNQEVICLYNELYGLLGKVVHVDSRKQLISVNIDKQKENQKIHDPFIGSNNLKSLMSDPKEEIQKAKSFFGDQDIEVMLKIKFGIISRITSSFLVQYRNPENGERAVVDLGLNIKNFSKKVHVPTFVRFVSSGENAAMNQHDGFTHNKFARGANHVRSHWEYSQECVDIIKQYHEQFPEVFEAVKKSGFKGPAVNKLKDVFGNESQESTAKLKRILEWIDSLPISHLPYVDMGFDALDPRMVQNIEQLHQNIKEQNQQANFEVKTTEQFKQYHVFAERFPFWTSPFAQCQSKDFRVGDRVMNINSCQREYIPFGFRGTVIGRTDEKVLVVFDEQFIGGSDLHNHCQQYKGAFVNPQHLLNLTKKFESIMKKHENPKAVLEMFTNSIQKSQKIENVEEPKRQVYKQKSQKQEQTVPQVVFQDIQPILKTAQSQKSENLGNEFSQMIGSLSLELENKPTLNSNSAPFQPQ